MLILVSVFAQVTQVDSKRPKLPTITLWCLNLFDTAQWYPQRQPQYKQKVYLRVCTMYNLYMLDTTNRSTIKYVVQKYPPLLQQQKQDAFECLSLQQMAQRYPRVPSATGTAQV